MVTLIQTILCHTIYIVMFNFICKTIEMYAQIHCPQCNFSKLLCYWLVPDRSLTWWSMATPGWDKFQCKQLGNNEKNNNWSHDQTPVINISMSTNTDILDHAIQLCFIFPYLWSSFTCSLTVSVHKRPQITLRFIQRQGWKSYANSLLLFTQ